MEDTSIQNEERFENLETKSRHPRCQWAKEESARVFSKGFDKASAIHCTRTPAAAALGERQRAFELFPQVPKKDANHWVSHPGARANLVEHTVISRTPPRK